MARNEWINGYLEAILDAGKSNTRKKINDRNHNNNNDKIKNIIPKFEGKDRDKLFSPTKYFVEEVVNSFDESDLHRTWIKYCMRQLPIGNFDGACDNHNWSIDGGPQHAHLQNKTPS